jgi:hypothetical protein
LFIILFCLQISVFTTDALHPTPHPSPKVTPSPQGEGLKIKKPQGVSRLAVFISKNI